LVGKTASVVGVGSKIFSANWNAMILWIFFIQAYPLGHPKVNVIYVGSDNAETRNILSDRRRETWVLSFLLLTQNEVDLFAFFSCTS
jgi:hypothetical protein